MIYKHVHFCILIPDDPKMELVKSSSETNGLTSRMEDAVMLEIMDSGMMSYEFDLGANSKGWKAVKYYGASMLFYSVPADGSAETETTVIEVLDYIGRFDSEGHGLHPFALKTATEIFIKLYSLADQINARPVKRIVTAEFVRTQLRYASPETEQKDKESLRRWRLYPIDKIRWALSGMIPTVGSIPSNTDIYFLLNKRKSDEELLALCTISYHRRPTVVHVETVASLVKGACTQMTLALAERLISTGTRILYLQSINNMAHGCYVKNYLRKFKYAFMWVGDSEKTSLIDHASTEIWLDYHSTGGNINNIQIDESVYMMYVLDDASLRAIVADRLFLRYSGRSRARMTVYCKKSKGVSEAMDEFMSPQYGKNRRALFIGDLNAYREKVPKRQKMADDNE